LLKAAAELIADRGTEQASLRSIGTRAGASRTMPAYHFGSKDELISRLVRQGDERTRAAYAAAANRAFASAENVSSLDALRITTKAYLELFDHAAPEDRAVIVIWGASFASDADMAGLKEADQETYEALVAVVRAGQQDGSIRADIDADVAAYVVIGMLRGVAAMLLTRVPTNLLFRVRDDCAEWIIAALAASDE
jgi:AcrR family transcriptional regulator